MIRIIRKRFYAVLAMCAVCGAVDAQYRKELSVHGGGVLSSMQYGVGGGEHRAGLGGNIGAGYRYFFVRRFGFYTGFEIASYRAVFKSDFGINEWSNDGKHPFEFRSKGMVKEKQGAVMMQIPIMFQYQNMPEDKKKYSIYGMFGFKLGLPVFGTYKISADYASSGYYPYEDYTYTAQRFKGFGNYNEKIGSGSLGLNPVISLPLPANGDSPPSSIDLPFAAVMSIELGMKRKIWINKTRALLYTGLYLDYGLNNLSNTENRTDKPVEANYSNNRLNINANSVFPENVTPVSAGIRVHLAYGWGDFNEKPVKRKKFALKKRLVQAQKCDCCRICLLKKKPASPCETRNRSFEYKTKYKISLIK